MDLILKLNTLFCVTLLPLVQGNTYGEIKSKPNTFNCSLSSNSATAKLLQRYFQDDKHVIWLNFTIEGQISTLDNNTTADVQNTNKWTFAKDENGKSLLLLDEQFELMSLYTLSPSVGEINALIEQFPENCLANVTEEEMKLAIRLHFLSLIDFTKDSNENIEICNTRLNEVMYECCSKMSNELLNCRTVQPGKWFKIFTICIYILVVIAWGFSIDLVPTKLLEKTKRVILPLPAENENSDSQERSLLLGSLEHISNSRSHRIYHYISHTQCLDINIRKLCHPNHATAGFFKWLWNSFVTFDIKDLNEDTKICCTQNIMCEGCWNCCVWYKCLRLFARLIIIAVTTSPFLFRFYVCFKGNSQLCNYGLVFYQITMYFNLLLMLLIRKCSNILKSLVIERKVRVNRLSEIISQCFRCMILQICERESNRFSLFHAILFPLSVVSAFVYFCLAVFPTSKFLGNVIYKTLKAKNLKERFKQGYIGALIIYSAIFFIDSIAFLVHCVVYFMAGLIFNYDTNLKYIGSFIFICLYGYEVIKNTNDTFETFKGTILKAVQLCHPKSETIKANTQYNDIYYNGLIGNQSKFTITQKGKKKMLRCKGGFIFFKECHGKYISVVSEKLLNQLASLKIHPSCPGSLSVLYIQAIGKIMSRTLLLVFVLFTVLALSYDLSSSMKTLFTLLSGFVVTHIRKFSSTSKRRSDDDSEFWQKKLTITENTNGHFLLSFEENWTICSRERLLEFITVMPSDTSNELIEIVLD